MPIPYITYLLIVANLIAFSKENYQGGSKNLETLYQLGALAPQDVFQGEWWRIFTANFLHYGWFHLMVNMLGLYFLGPTVELSLGKIRYLLVYFFSGCGAMLLIAWLFLQWDQINTLVVGASAAIMGLLGAMAAIFLQDWLRSRNSLAIRRFIILILIIGLQFLIDYTTPHISLMSHLIGLILGFISGLFLV